MWLRAVLALFQVATPGYVCWSGHIRNSMSRREYRTWRRTKRVTCGRCGEPMVRFGEEEEEE